MRKVLQKKEMNKKESIGTRNIVLYILYSVTMKTKDMLVVISVYKLDDIGTKIIGKFFK